MHFFNVNLSKYILKKELTKLNTIIYKILIITSSKSLIINDLEEVIINIL